MKSTISWAVILCSLGKAQHFGGIYEGGSINKVTGPLIAYISSNNIYTYNQ
jgi:hypothetical protein